MFQILGLLLWLVVIPYCIGLIPANFISENRRTAGFIFLAGYFSMWALFGLVTIPIVIFLRYDNFIPASNGFMILSILCAVAGVWLVYRRRRGKVHGKTRAGTGHAGAALNSYRKIGFAESVRRMSWAERIEWILVLALLGFQLYKAVAYASFDGDDAYYVVESLIAQQADTMYTILPLTGRHTGLDIRHAMAVFPMWVAFIATKSHIHATILSHTVMPLLLIPLTYLTYYEIGALLFGTRITSGSAEKRENLPVFMIIMEMFQIFGNVSLYTNETFFLTRTWQGKAVTGSLVIPAILWVFLLLYDSAGEERTAGRKPGIWFLLICVNTTAGICSSIALFLVSILMAVTALCLAFVERDWKVVIRMGAACIPNAVYMLTYLAVAYGHLLG